MPIDGPDRHVAVLHAFAQLQRPGLPLPLEVFSQHLHHMHRRAQASFPEWNRFLSALFPLDAYLVAACLENQPAAWETLFQARAGRIDRLLVDALRQRAARIYPGDEEKQETAVADFWGHLLVAPAEDSEPILRRFDGVRPLVPWLIRVFQNRLISQVRSPRERGESLVEDDLLASPNVESPLASRWNELFADAARGWLDSIDEEERLLLGLRWRFRLSQRDIAELMGVHEGTTSRQISALRDKALRTIASDLERAGWTGEDLEGIILREMASVLLDEPRLSAEAMARLLKARKLTLPMGKGKSL